jgi:hypothetical protein
MEENIKKMEKLIFFTILLLIYERVYIMSKFFNPKYWSPLLLGMGIGLANFFTSQLQLLIGAPFWFQAAIINLTFPLLLGLLLYLGHSMHFNLKSELTPEEKKQCKAERNTQSLYIIAKSMAALFCYDLCRAYLISGQSLAVSAAIVGIGAAFGAFFIATIYYANSIKTEEIKDYSLTLLTVATSASAWFVLNSLSASGALSMNYAILYGAAVILPLSVIYNVLLTANNGSAPKPKKVITQSQSWIYKIPVYALAIALGDAAWLILGETLTSTMAVWLPLVAIPFAVAIINMIGEQMKPSAERSNWRENTYLLFKMAFAMGGWTAFSMIPTTSLLQTALATGLGTAIFILIPATIWHFVIRSRDDTPKIEKVADINALFFSCLLAGLTWTLYSNIAITGPFGLAIKAILIFCTATGLFTLYDRSQISYRRNIEENYFTRREYIQNEDTLKRDYLTRIHPDLDPAVKDAQIIGSLKTNGTPIFSYARKYPITQGSNSILDRLTSNLCTIETNDSDVIKGESWKTFKKLWERENYTSPITEEVFRKIDWSNMIQPAWISNGFLLPSGLIKDPDSQTSESLHEINHKELTLLATFYVENGKLHAKAQRNVFPYGLNNFLYMDVRNKKSGNIEKRVIRNDHTPLPSISRQHNFASKDSSNNPFQIYIFQFQGHNIYICRHDIRQLCKKERPSLRECIKTLRENKCSDESIAQLTEISLQEFITKISNPSNLYEALPVDSIHATGHFHIEPDGLFTTSYSDCYRLTPRNKLEMGYSEIRLASNQKAFAIERPLYFETQYFSRKHWLGLFTLYSAALGGITAVTLNFWLLSLVCIPAVLGIQAILKGHFRQSPSLNTGLASPHIPKVRETEAETGTKLSSTYTALNKDFNFDYTGNHTSRLRPVPSTKPCLEISADQIRSFVHAHLTKEPTDNDFVLNIQANRHVDLNSYQVKWAKIQQQDISLQDIQLTFSCTITK